MLCVAGEEGAPAPPPALIHKGQGFIADTDLQELDGRIQHLWDKKARLRKVKVLWRPVFLTRPNPSRRGLPPGQEKLAM